MANKNTKNSHVCNGRYRSKSNHTNVKPLKKEEKKEVVLLAVAIDRARIVNISQLEKYIHELPPKAMREHSAHRRKGMAWLQSYAQSAPHL